ncbi:MAG: alpha/beta hydrolase fold domain-containing protein [Planctomycetaceae bacterium]|nr:alpha/beta hydrolase fold domain-containing protein [Planctomycetaceae bacterium]
MFQDVIRSVLFGCLIWMIVQVQVTSKGSVQKRRSGASESYAPTVPTPTIQSARYGDHERNVVDIWQAEGKSPTPLVLVIHGGGWLGGAKERVDRFVDVQALLNAGISVAALNYRFVDQAIQEGVEPPVKAPLYDAARCLQFIRSKAKLWNIDTTQIAAAGGSAGACSSLWLAFHDDLCELTSDDLVARQSTRLCCAAVKGAQTSLDPKQMKEWTPNSKYGGHAFGFLGFKAFLNGRDSILPLLAEYSPYSLVTKNDPPVYLIYSTPPSLGQDQRDPTHTSNFGVKLKNHCQKKDVPCELVYPGAPDILHADTTSFLIGKLSVR